MMASRVAAINSCIVFGSSCRSDSYLFDNPLLKVPLTKDHIKPRLLGHWGTTPGLNFIYAHLNRLIKKLDLDMIYITGPGHGGPGLVANAYLEGTYSEVYPNISQDEEGIKRLFTQFSFPGGIPSHVAPETPGSMHEGGELGYALSHAYGAAFDNPDLIVACVVGDGEAETGPLATSWHSNKFLNPYKGRGGPADPASQRLQDRQSDRACAHPARRDRVPPSRLWLRAAFRRGRPPASRRRSARTLSRTRRSPSQALLPDASVFDNPYTASTHRCKIGSAERISRDLGFCCEYSEVAAGLQIHIINIGTSKTLQEHMQLKTCSGGSLRRPNHRTAFSVQVQPPDPLHSRAAS